MEAGNVSGSRFSAFIKAETQVGTHGTVSGHSDLSRRTGGRYYKVVANKIELELCESV